MRKWWKQAVLLLMVAVAGLGLGRIRFNTNILEILPGEMPEVVGLKSYYEVFSLDEELVVLIEADGESSEPLGEAAEELAGLLKEAGVAKGARWKPTLDGSAGGDGGASGLALAERRIEGCGSAGGFALRRGGGSDDA